MVSRGRMLRISENMWEKQDHELIMPLDICSAMVFDFVRMVRMISERKHCCMVVMARLSSTARPSSNLFT